MCGKSATYLSTSVTTVWFSLLGRFPLRLVPLELIVKAVAVCSFYVVLFVVLWLLCCGCCFGFCIVFVLL